MRRKTTAILILSASCALLAGCTEAGEHIPRYGAAAAATHGSAAPQVVALPDAFDKAKELGTSQAELHALPVILHANGQIQPDETAVTRINSPLTGRVIQIGAVVGDLVKPKQVMFTVCSEDVEVLEAELLSKENDISSELQRELLQVDFEIRQANAKLAFAKKSSERAERLVIERIGSQASMEAARNEYETATLLSQSLQQKRPQIISIAEEKRKLFRQGLRQRLKLLGMPDTSISQIFARQQLNPIIPITTPRAGIVLDRQVNVGELIDPAKSAFVVDDLDNVWLVADIYEKDISRVQVGQSVNFTVDSFPGEVFKGKLNFVGRAINPEARTLQVRAEVANPSLRLKPKMFARMDIVAGTKNVLTVPRSAIVNCGSNNVAYVQNKNGMYEERPVQVGIQSGNLVEVISGLSAGENVVIKGGFTLRACSLARTE